MEKLEILKEIIIIGLPLGGSRKTPISDSGPKYFKE